METNISLATDDLARVVGLFVLPVKNHRMKEQAMNVFKVTFSHAWNRWKDFTSSLVVQGRSNSKAMAEIDIPEVMNEKVDYYCVSGRSFRKEENKIMDNEKFLNR